MTDNKNEEPLSISTNIQLENPSEEMTTPEEPVTINQNEATDNMEVHHHPDIHHKPKKWKEYFLEFLMIFLAVTMGFIAENIREHFVEKGVEEKYIKSYLADLKSDSARFDRIIDRNVIAMNSIDKTLKLIHLPIINDSVSRSLYELNQKVTGFSVMLFIKRTLSQLKSAGGYKLISNNILCDSMVGREIDIEWAEMLAQRLYNLTYEIRTHTASKIFDTYLVYDDLNQNATDQRQLSRDPVLTNTKKFPLLSTSKEDIAAYSNNLISLQWNLKNYNNELKRYQLRCKNLIRLIERE